jgi:hypothetical protein
VVAAGCKHVPRVSMSSKSYEHKQKGDLCTVPFLQWIKIPKSVFQMSRNLWHSNVDTLATEALPWHCWPLGTIKIGFYDVVGELFVIDLWDLSRMGHICWHHSGDLYLFGHVVCDMPVTLVGVSSCCHSSMVVLSANILFIYIWYGLADGRCCEVADCLGSDSTMRNYVVQLDVLICRITLPWWTCNLQFSSSNSIFHDFKLRCGSMWILFKSIF